MKKLSMAVLLFITLLFMTGTASATLFVDFDPNGHWFNEENESYTWTFDLDQDNLLMGDINPEDSIDAAYLTISFFDDFDFRSEYAQLTFDGTTTWANQEIDWGFAYFDVLPNVLNDHFLEVSITRNAGDFGVGWITLKGNYTDNPLTPTPEPGTLFLMGSGLLGLAGVRLRKWKK